MGEAKILEAWKEDVELVLQSKLEEFHMMGYESVSIEELWGFIEAKVAKKKKEWMLHELVNAIFRLTINDFMNWLTIEAFQNDNLFNTDN